jgi:hypothetical protein
VQIFLFGRNLKNLDKGRDKSDTFVVLKMKWSGNQKDWIEVDQTETCFNNLEPNWVKTFDVIFNFGQKLDLRFEVMNKTSSKAELIGFHETTLVEIVRQSKGIENKLSGPH